MVQIFLNNLTFLKKKHFRVLGFFFFRKQLFTGQLNTRKGRRRRIRRIENVSRNCETWVLLRFGDFCYQVFFLSYSILACVRTTGRWNSLIFLKLRASAKTGRVFWQVGSIGPINTLSRQGCKKMPSFFYQSFSSKL